MKVNITIDVLNEANEKVCIGDVVKVKTKKDMHIGRVCNIESNGLRLDCNNVIYGFKSLRYDSILTIETLQ